MINEKCEHCQEEIVHLHTRKIDQKNIHFCCEGCATVYEILQTHDLKNYYQLRTGEKQSISQRNLEKKAQYKYLDHPEFTRKFIDTVEGRQSIRFYVEGVHCTACLWLIEKLPELDSRIQFVRLNMSNSIATIHFSKTISPSQIAELLQRIGYPPHPILEESDVLSQQKKENKKELLRIGISFFCMGNIMLYAFSNYLGASDQLKVFFDGLAGVLFLPILFYSSIPFFKNSIGSFKGRSISIDLPIVIALLLGAGFSYHQLYLQSSHIYFDTLATLVFLILTSRFLLKQAQQRSLKQANLKNYYANLPTRRWVQDRFEDVFTDFIKVGDRILVKAGETIPLDGVILKGESSTNNSFVTGELTPQVVRVGDEVYSGCINLSTDLELRVEKNMMDSTLGSILSKVEQGWLKKTELITLTDKISKYFVSIQLTLALIVFAYFSFVIDFETAYIRALTLIIITCPCALGLTPPLSFTLGLAKLARKGILVKDETVLERISKIQNIFFDKTGTLTKAQFKVSSWIEINADPHLYSILLAIEGLSQHPIAKAVTNYLAHKFPNLEPAPISNFQEIPGVEVKAKFNELNYRIIPLRQSDKGSGFSFYQEDTLSLEVTLDDSMLPDLPILFDSLSKKYQLFILSGDNHHAVNEVGEKLKIPSQRIFSQVTPEQKKDVVAKHPHSMMIGDGANDAIALAEADVGVAVKSSLDIAMRAGNVVFTSGSTVKNVETLVVVGAEIIRVIKRNLLFSLIYNLLGTYLALNGLISPLLAAILMPVSSLTVLLSSLISTRSMRSSLS